MSSKIEGLIYFLAVVLSLTIGVLAFFVFEPSFKGDNTFTVGIVNPNPILEPVVKGFKDGLAARGYKEGGNVSYLYDRSVRKGSELRQYVKELVSQDVDMLFTLTTPATLMAKELTAGSGMPVVFDVYAPVKSGIVDSLSDHGSNMTGIQIDGSAQKALESLMLVAPDVKRVLVPVAYDTKAALQSMDDLKLAADKLNVELIVNELESVDDLLNALESGLAGVDAVFVPISIMVVSNISAIIKAAIDHKLPLASGTEQYKKGALISYAHNHYLAGKQAGRLAGKILKGTPPSYLPVEQCDFFLGINMQTANEIGMEIPERILLQADFIIR